MSRASRAREPTSLSLSLNLGSSLRVHRHVLRLISLCHRADSLHRYGSDRDDSLPNGFAPSGSSSRLVPRRGLEGSDASDDEVDVSGESLRHKRKQAFGIAALIAHPPTHVAETEDWASGDAERRRLREYYAREGWLPGPKPGQKTRQRRRRVM